MLLINRTLNLLTSMNYSQTKIAASIKINNDYKVLCEVDNDDKACAKIVIRIIHIINKLYSYNTNYVINLQDNQGTDSIYNAFNILKSIYKSDRDMYDFYLKPSYNNIGAPTCVSVGELSKEELQEILDSTKNIIEYYKD